MKKLIIVVALLGFTQASTAKNGGSNPVKLEFKNSQAGFVSESLEHSLRLLTIAQANMKDRVEDASIIMEDVNHTRVTISLDDNSAVTFLCSRVDELSKGGTILKKEVICQMK